MIKSWAIHNLFGHPLMQIFSWVGLPTWGIKIHDATTPQQQSLWTLEQAQIFCTNLRVFLSTLGYDVGMTGGTLFRGQSDKDIDIIIYPMKKRSANFESMYRKLPEFNLKFIRLPNHNLGYQDDGKKVEIWEFQGKRVDLFFLT